MKTIGPFIMAFLLLAGAARTETNPPDASGGRKPAFVAAHITDAHIRTEFNAPARFRAAVAHMRRNHPDASMVFVTGDTVDGVRNQADGDVKWGVWKSVAADELKDMSIVAALGNHDTLEPTPTVQSTYGRDAVCRFLAMPARYYSFSTNGWHIIVLDGNKFAADKTQWEWLTQQLSTIDPATPIAILSHHPIFSMGAMIHSPGDLIGRWKDIVALFVKHPNVKVCISGHVHLYDTSWYNGVTYVCGGAMSGYWWETTKSTDGKSSYHETRPGYGIARFYTDGTFAYEYVPFEGASIK